jgi:hypothetical protein
MEEGEDQCGAATDGDGDGKMDIKWRQHSMTARISNKADSFPDPSSVEHQRVRRRLERLSLPFSPLTDPSSDGKQKCIYAFTKIAGVGRRYAQLVCRKADVDTTKRAGVCALSALRTAGATPLTFSPGADG